MKNLLDQVLDQLLQDVTAGDLTAIEELLKFVPIKNLQAYLPEEVTP